MILLYLSWFVGHGCKSHRVGYGEAKKQFQGQWPSTLHFSQHCHMSLTWRGMDALQSPNTWPTLAQPLSCRSPSHRTYRSWDPNQKKKPLKFGIDQKNNNLKTWFMKHYQVYDTELIHITWYRVNYHFFAIW